MLDAGGQKTYGPMGIITVPHEHPPLPANSWCENLGLGFDP